MIQLSNDALWFLLLMSGGVGALYALTLFLIVESKEGNMIKEENDDKNK